MNFKGYVLKQHTTEGQAWARLDADGREIAGTLSIHEAPPLPVTPFDVDPCGRCERAALHECVEHSHGWTYAERDKASFLLRKIFTDRIGQHGLLLQGATRDVYKALIGPWCGIEGRNGEAVFPELRWCNFPRGIVCYRAGLSSPLYTDQFERHRERLEELWGGPVLIETGASIGAAPGCVVVRPAPPMISAAPRVPPTPRMPLALPEKIPLEIPRREGGWE